MGIKWSETTCGELVSDCGRFMVRREMRGESRKFVCIINSNICHHGSKKACLLHAETVKLVASGKGHLIGK